MQNKSAHEASNKALQRVLKYLGANPELQLEGTRPLVDTYKYYSDDHDGDYSITYIDVYIHTCIHVYNSLKSVLKKRIGLGRWSCRGRGALNSFQKWENIDNVEQVLNKS